MGSHHSPVDNRRMVSNFIRNVTCAFCCIICTATILLLSRCPREILVHVSESHETGFKEHCCKSENSKPPKYPWAYSGLQYCDFFHSVEWYTVVRMIKLNAIINRKQVWETKTKEYNYYYSIYIKFKNREK